MKSYSKLVSFMRQNLLLVGVFTIACGVALWFLTHIALDFLYFNDPKNQDVDLRGWMTPRYIVRTYDLPRDLVLETLQIEENQQRGAPLRRIASDLGLTMDELTDLIRQTAETYRGQSQ